MPNFHRLAHMKDSPKVKVGDWVKRGQLLGFVGSTGASTGPHCHYDIFNTDKLGWTFYVYGWGLARLKMVFQNPSKYVSSGIPIVNSLPLAGYQYLQYVKSNGGYYHPGMDLNGVNDLGKPVLSPVEGRVRCVFGTSWIKNTWGKLVGKNYNSGWGNMVVIEEMPGFKL